MFSAPQTQVYPQKVSLAAVIANKHRISPTQLCQTGGFLYTYVGKALKYRPDLCPFLPKNKRNEQPLFCLRPSESCAEPQRCCDFAAHLTGLTAPQLHQQGWLFIVAAEIACFYIIFTMLAVDNDPETVLLQRWSDRAPTRIDRTRHAPLEVRGRD